METNIILNQGAQDVLREVIASPSVGKGDIQLTAGAIDVIQEIIG